MKVAVVASKQVRGYSQGVALKHRDLRGTQHGNQQRKVSIPTQPKKAQLFGKSLQSQRASKPSQKLSSPFHTISKVTTTRPTATIAKLERTTKAPLSTPTSVVLFFRSLTTSTSSKETQNKTKQEEQHNQSQQIEHQKQQNQQQSNSNESMSDFQTFWQKFLAEKDMGERWSAKWWWNTAVIWTVFAITGSSSAFFARPFVGSVLGLEGSMREGPWSYRIISLIAIMPIYTILLVIIGTLLGRHAYFKKFAIKMWSRLLPASFKNKFLK